MKLTEAERKRILSAMNNPLTPVQAVYTATETILTAHVEQAEYKTESHIYMRWKHMCRNYRAITLSSILKKGMCNELGNTCDFTTCPLRQTKEGGE